jgi:hypothetical protein
MTDPMPVFTIKAKDALAVDAVFAYRSLCEKRGLVAQVHEVDKAIQEIRQWRTRNKDLVQMPDHVHVPADEEATP